MRVALAFREPDVDRFLAGMTLGQFFEWCEFLSLLEHGDTAPGTQQPRRSTGRRMPAEQIQAILRARLAPLIKPAR